MRVVSWNIQHLEQYDRSTDLESALKAMLRSQNPDVLLLQEVDVNKARTDFANQAGLIASKMEASFTRFAETKLVPAEDGNYGIAIASKIPVTTWHSLELRRSPIGRRLTFEFGDSSETFYVADHPRAALAAVLENGYLVVNTHLSFMPVAAQMQMIRVAIWAKKLARKHNAKLIIGGDLNFVNSKWLRIFGLSDAVIGNTFPAWKPTKQIDHFLVEEIGQVKASEIGDEGPIGDHRWIAIELSL